MSKPPAPAQIATQLDSDPGVVVGTVIGDLDRQGLESGASMAWATHGWKGRAVLWDLRKAHLVVTSNDLERFARFIHDHQPDPPPGRVIFVTTSDLEFGLARIFEVYRDDEATEFRVLRDFEAALDWARGAE